MRALQRVRQARDRPALLVGSRRHGVHMQRSKPQRNDHHECRHERDGIAGAGGQASQRHVVYVIRDVDAQIVLLAEQIERGTDRAVLTVQPDMYATQRGGSPRFHLVPHTGTRSCHSRQSFSC